MRNKYDSNTIPYPKLRPPMPKCDPPKDYIFSDLDKYYDYECENTLEIDPFPNNENFLKMGNSMDLEQQAMKEICSNIMENHIKTNEDIVSGKGLKPLENICGEKLKTYQILTERYFGEDNIVPIMYTEDYYNLNEALKAHDDPIRIYEKRLDGSSVILYDKYGTSAINIPIYDVGKYEKFIGEIDE